MRIVENNETIISLIKQNIKTYLLIIANKNNYHCLQDNRTLGASLLLSMAAVSSHNSLSVN